MTSDYVERGSIRVTQVALNTRSGTQNLQNANREPELRREQCRIFNLLQSSLQIALYAMTPNLNIFLENVQDLEI